jgi:hypothetical protein
MQLEEPGNATPATSNRLAGSHRLLEIGRFIVITPVLELDVSSSDHP